MGLQSKIVFFDLDETVFSRIPKARTLPHCQTYPVSNIQLTLLYPTLLWPILKFCSQYHLLGFITCGGYSPDDLKKVLQNMLRLNLSVPEFSDILLFNRNDWGKEDYQAFLTQRGMPIKSPIDDRKNLQLQYLLQTEKGKALLQKKLGRQSYSSADIVFTDDTETVLRKVKQVADYCFLAQGMQGDLTYLTSLARVVGLDTYQVAPGHLTNEGRAYLKALSDMNLSPPAEGESFVVSLRRYADLFRAGLENFIQWFHQNATGPRFRHFKHPASELQSVEGVKGITEPEDFIDALGQCLANTGSHKHSPWFFIKEVINNNSNDFVDISVPIFNDDVSVRVQCLSQQEDDSEVSNFSRKLYLGYYLRALLGQKLLSNERLRYAVSEKNKISMIFLIMAEAMQSFLLWYARYAHGMRRHNFAFNSSDAKFAQDVFFSFSSAQFFEKLDNCLAKSTRVEKGIWVHVAYALSRYSEVNEVGGYKIADYLAVESIERVYCNRQHGRNEKLIAKWKLPYIILFLRAYLKLIQGVLLGKSANDVYYDGSMYVDVLLRDIKPILQSETPPLDDNAPVDSRI